MSTSSVCVFIKASNMHDAFYILSWPVLTRPLIGLCYLDLQLRKPRQIQVAAITHGHGWRVGELGF